MQIMHSNVGGVMALPSFQQSLCKALGFRLFALASYHPPNKEEIMDRSDDQIREETNRCDGAGVGGGGRGTSIHITALDGIVNVNSLFTLAVFLGLAWNPTDPAATLAAPECVAGSHVEESLVSFHVYAFSSFLFSSLVALCLKQAIRLARPHQHAVSARVARVNRTLLRAGILASAVGSVFACGFLVLALINVVQVKLGRLGCGSSAAVGAIIPLVTLVPAAMLFYTCIVFYAFTR